MISAVTDDLVAIQPHPSAWALHWEAQQHRDTHGAPAHDCSRRKTKQDY